MRRKDDKMGKLVKFDSHAKKDERLEEISERLSGLKKDLALLLEAYEEEKVNSRRIDVLTEALDALEDANDVIGDVLAED